MLGPKLDDGFTPIRNKKKWRGITLVNSISNFVNSNSPPILNPPLSVVPFEHPASSIEAVKPALNPSKAPPKVFKEIEDGYIFEVIPASGSVLFDLNMDKEPSVLDESPKLDTFSASRRGRPPRSKNNSTNKNPEDAPGCPNMNIEDASHTSCNMSQ